MHVTYKINQYGRTRLRPNFSIDRVFDNGEYLSQVAFFFRSRAAAEKRLSQILVEDAEQGITSTVFPRPK